MDTSNLLARRRFSPMAAYVAAAAIVLTALPVTAQPSDAAATAPSASTTKSRALFEQGLDAYGAGNYEAATRHWTEAYDLMSNDPTLLEGRRVLGFDLAQAHMRAYGTDRDPKRLDAARPLLESYVAWVDRPEHTMNDAEREDRQRAVELLEQIDDETRPDAVPPLPRVEAPAPAPQPAVAPSPPNPQRNGTGLLVAGGLSLGGGIASMVAASAFFHIGNVAERQFEEAAANEDTAGIDQANRDGSRANVGFLTSAVAATALTVAGVTMLAVGGVRRRRFVSASAAVTPQGGMASLSFNF